MKRFARPAVGAAVVTAAALATAGCRAGTPPPATPMDLSSLVTELVRHRVAVVRTISGDPGCADPNLAPNGVHMLLTLPPAPTVYDAYLFTFKDRATWAAGASSVAACAKDGTSTAAAAADGRLLTIEVSPFRAFGVGWPAALRSALQETIQVAARGGTDPGAGQPEE